MLCLCKSNTKLAKNLFIPGKHSQLLGHHSVLTGSKIKSVMTAVTLC